MRGEKTLFLDKRGKMICVGDKVRVTTADGFSTYHGTWVDYKIRKAPGGYVASYFRSAAGQVMPKDFSACYMADRLDGEDETDLKTLVFAKKSIKLKEWEIIK